MFSSGDVDGWGDGSDSFFGSEGGRATGAWNGTKPLFIKGVVCSEFGSEYCSRGREPMGSALARRRMRPSVASRAEGCMRDRPADVSCARPREKAEGKGAGRALLLEVNGLAEMDVDIGEMWRWARAGFGGSA